MAKLVGASETFDPAKLAELDEDTKADTSIEVSGVAAGLQTALDYTGYGGRVIIGSWYGNHAKPAALKLGLSFHRSHLRILVSQVSHKVERGRFHGLIIWLDSWTDIYLFSLFAIYYLHRSVVFQLNYKIDGVKLAGESSKKLGDRIQAQSEGKRLTAISNRRSIHLHRFSAAWELLKRIRPSKSLTSKVVTPFKVAEAFKALDVQAAETIAVLIDYSADKRPSRR